MATTTKTRKPSTTKPKPTRKPKPKQTAKPKGKKSTAKPKTTKRASVSRTIGTRRPELSDAAKRASELICTDESGKPNKRAPLGTVQLGKVSDQLVGRKRPADVLRSLMFGGPKFKRDESLTRAHKLATDWADGKIGQTDLPDGARTRFGAASEVIGDPKQHKVSGKALAAALVGLAEHKPKKS